MISKTTHVGSLPRISGLDVEQSAELAIKAQVASGVDEVNDGEYGRNIFFGDITSLPGFKSGVRKIRFSAGDITTGPQVVGKVQYDPENPTAPKEVQRTKRVLERLGVERKVKVTIPSVTMLSIFYPKPEEASPELKEIYPTFDSYTQDIIPIVLNEAREAFRAGADVVQFDAPDFLEYPAKEKMRERVALENEVLKHLDSSKLEHHSCWGNYLETQVCTEGHFDAVLPEIYDLKSDNIGPLEIFDGIRDFDELKYFREYKPGKKTLVAGIVSVKSRNVEPVSVLKRRYDAVADAIGGTRIIASPGCGFSSGTRTLHTLEEVQLKLTNLVAAVG